MHGQRTILLILAVLLAGGAGCARRSDSPAGGREVGPSGRVSLTIPASVLLPGIARVDLTVSAGTGPAFAPIDVPLSVSSGGFSGFVTGIPAGPGRRFDVTAYDVGGAVLATGFAIADVLAGETAVVFITLGSPLPNPYRNSAPVIDYLSASRTKTQPGTDVVLNVLAHDPDPADTIAYEWAATCGSIDVPTATRATWTAPSASTTCQLSVTVTDNHSAAVTSYLVVQVITDTGNVLVNVIESGGPAILGLAVDAQYQTSVGGDLAVTAVNPGGGPLAYAWTSSCPGLTFDTSPPYAPATPHFTSTDTTLACVITVTATDGGGAAATGVVTLPPLLPFNVAAQITSTVQPSVDITDPLLAEVVRPGDAIPLYVEATDPEGGDLVFEWVASAGSLDPQIDQVHSPGSSSIVWHAPDVLPLQMRVTITVRDPQGEPNSHIFFFKPPSATDPCATLSDGTPCDDGNACTSGEQCQGGVCTGGTLTTCTALDQCHAVGVCNPYTGLCSNPYRVNGTTCDDGQACTVNDVCAAGLCMGQNKVCTALDQCHDVGTCDAATGLCGNPVSPDTRTCDDGKGCTTSDHCTAGVCGGTLVTCPTGSCIEPGGTCPAAGAPVAQLLIDAGANPSPGAVPGLAYDELGYLYQGGNMYQPGFDFGCGLVNSAGSADAFVVKLDPATGRCAPGIGWSKDFGDASNDQTLTALAVNRSAVAFAGQYQGTLPLGGTTSVTNSGAIIDYVGALNRVTGAPLWVKNFDLNEPTSPPATYGKINAIAGGLSGTNPSGSRFAVCGFVGNPATCTVSPANCKVAASLVNDPAATPGGGLDAVVAVLDGATGNLVWGRQLGGTGDQTCNAVAFDDAGNVLITGTYTGVLTIPGATLTQPSGSNRWAFVAKLDGSTGATLAATNFGAATTARITPRAIAAAADGSVAVGGQFQATMTFPTTPTATTLTGTGTSFDIFVARLDATLAPVWAKRFGGSAPDDLRGMSVDSTGQVIVAGVFSSTATSTWGMPTLASAGATDVLYAGLDPGTGNANFAVQAGDAYGQEPFALAVCRLATGANQDTTWMAGGYASGITFSGQPTLASGSTTNSHMFLVKLH
jgi:hypothetical protein